MWTPAAINSQQQATDPPTHKHSYGLQKSYLPNLATSFNTPSTVASQAAAPLVAVSASLLGRRYSASGTSSTSGISSASSTPRRCCSKDVTRSCGGNVNGRWRRGGGEWTRSSIESGFVVVDLGLRVKREGALGEIHGLQAL
jgi:hypothetical protein